MLEAAVFCMAMAIYHEARGEPYMGQIAVGEVITNRVESFKYPNTVCEVVKQKGQFAFKWVKPKEREAWNNSVKLAKIVLENDIIGHSAEYYFTGKKPKWAYKMEFIGKIGAHEFYTTQSPYAPKKSKMPPKKL